MTDTAASAAATTTPPAQVDADRALKQKHRAMWASGDYPTLASDLIWELGPRVVAAAEVRPGERVLDIAAGSGNASIPAALRGATVVATDLAPELFDVGRRLATEAGAELEWREADAEALPFEDDAFDVALSTVGIMFAPHHERAADELVRVVKPGGRIGADQLDAAGIHRPDVQDHEALRRRRSPRARSPRRSGATSSTCASCSATGSTTSTAARETVAIDHFDSGEDVPRLLQAPLRPDDRGLQPDRRRPRPGAGPRRGARRTRPGARRRSGRLAAVGVPAVHRSRALTGHPPHHRLTAATSNTAPPKTAPPKGTTMNLSDHYTTLDLRRLDEARLGASSSTDACERNASPRSRRPRRG